MSHWEKCEQWNKKRDEATKVPLKVGDQLFTWDKKPIITKTTDRGNSMVRVGFSDVIHHPDEGWRPTDRTILPGNYGMVVFLSKKVDEIAGIVITRIHANNNSAEANVVE